MGDGGDNSRLKPGLRSALAAVGHALATLPAPGMLIGGMAVIARGVPRVTLDVDLTIAGGVMPLPELVVALGSLDLQARIDDPIGFAEANHVVLLRHQSSNVDVDLSIAWLPFEREAIDSAQPVTIADLQIPVARPEDLIVYKAVAFRPQDQQDIERLLALYRDDIDLNRVRGLVRQFAEALEDPERLNEFDRLIRQTT
ncbi:MAG: nucleotidyltransferase [Acidimicrobiia bacterium]